MSDSAVPVSADATPAPNAPVQGTSLAALLAPTLTSPVAFGAGVATTSIDDESIGGGDFDFYKITKGKKDRLFFLTPGSIFHARAHYSEGNGFLICLSTYKKQGDKEIMVTQGECCKRLTPARKRCAGLVLQYVTDMQGKPIPADPLFQMKVWRFNDKTFSQLRDMNAQFPLASHDFHVTLDGDEKYQGCNLMPINGAPISAHPKFIEKYGVMVRDWVQAIQPQLERTVGRRLEPAKWAEILKLATTPAANALPAAEEAVGGMSLEELLS